jgi:hypothetical protein
MHFNITIKLLILYAHILIVHLFVYRCNRYSIVIQANQSQFQLPYLTHRA